MGVSGRQGCGRAGGRFLTAGDWSRPSHRQAWSGGAGGGLRVQFRTVHLFSSFCFAGDAGDCRVLSCEFRIFFPMGYVKTTRDPGNPGRLDFSHGPEQFRPILAARAAQHQATGYPVSPVPKSAPADGVGRAVAGFARLSISPRVWLPSALSAPPPPPLPFQSANTSELVKSSPSFEHVFLKPRSSRPRAIWSGSSAPASSRNAGGWSPDSGRYRPL